MLFLKILALGCMLFLLIYISKIKVHLEYHRNQQDDRFFVNVALIKGLLEFKSEFTALDLEKKLVGMAVQVDSKIEAEMAGAETDVKMDDSIPLSYRNIKRAYSLFREFLYNLRLYKDVIIRLISFTNVRELDWRTRFGFGDAAETGIAAGLLWGVKSTVVQQIYRWTRASENIARLSVFPDFAGNSLNIDMRCIFDIKTGHIIIAGCKILIIRFKLLFLRTVKGV